MSRRRPKRRPACIIQTKEDSTKVIYVLDKKGALMKDPSSPIGFKTITIESEKKKEMQSAPLKVEEPIAEEETFNTKCSIPFDFLNDNGFTIYPGLESIFDL